VKDRQQIVRRLRRSYLRFRRPLAAVLAAAAVLVLAHIASPPPAESVPVVVAAHDLTGGTAVGSGDVRIERMPTSLAPRGSFSATSTVIGRTVAAPMRTGESLTDRRLLGRALIAGYAPGLVAAPVRIQDSDVVSLLQAGDFIDVYAASSARGPASLIASAAPVVLLPHVSTDSQSGALVVLAVTPADAARIAAASATSPLSVTLRG
jgi:Flp pilus assembly protein CpaB